MGHRKEKEASPHSLVAASHQPAGNQHFFYIKIFSNEDVEIMMKPKA